MRTIGATFVAMAVLAAGCSGTGTGTGTDESAVDAASFADPFPFVDPGLDLDPDPGPVSDPGEAGDPGTGSGDIGDAGPCTDGATECSEDAHILRTCKDGSWIETACMADQGRLCEAGACVDPWRYGSPAWSTCPDETRGTPETLAQKAAWYDALVPRLHIHPKMPWALGVLLKEGATEASATWQDVERWHIGENDGLWSALYLTSQAFRYSVTKSPEALATIRTLLAGEVQRMEITGVPGVFTRQFQPPDVPGAACPTNPDEYVPDVEKDDNKWVKIQDGCDWVVDRDTKEWKKTDVCGLSKYEGYCWLDNVSQDEYAGHMLALGAIWKLVDDPDVRATTKDLIEKVALHLVRNKLAFIDWDGRVTEHGKLWITSIADSPGFLSAAALDLIRMGVAVSDAPEIRDFYDNCLLQKGGPKPCLPWPLEAESPLNYLDSIEQMLLFPGDNGCKANYNNFSMMFTWLHNLVWFETEPEVRGRVQDAWASQFMHPTDPNALLRAGALHRNSWFDFGFAAFKRLGPGSTGPALDEVKDGICSLKQFPASKTSVAKDAQADYPFFCEGRLGGEECELPIPVADRCPRTFLWWGDPFSRSSCKCGDDPRNLQPPGDYLLAYWMGRYFGFIPETL